ncbi:MAG: CRTAC1 family protein [Bacteroidota bacterium]
MKLIYPLVSLLLITSSLYGQYYQNANYRFNFLSYSGTGYLGSGISFCDINNDGFDDISIATETGEPPHFYINTNGFFIKNLLVPGLLCDSKHLLWADYDNDGDKDLLITCEDGANKLYNNDGNLVLTDVSVAAGIPQTIDPTFGAAFGDYNNDGWLDIYLVNRSFGGILSDATNYLYQNMGNGTFQDVTAATATADFGKGPFCAAFIDYNGDGWQDIHISVDKYNAPNTMFLNDGMGQYINTSVSTGTDISIDAMSITPGDYDNDGDEDLYITNGWLPPYNVLFKNNGDETFTNSATAAGVLYQDFCWAANFLDFNNDSHLDLYVCSQANTGNPNALFLNNGDETFTHLSITGDNFISFSNAVGDYNNDGKLDMVTSGHSVFPTAFYENISTNTNNYIKVDLQGTISNRDGIGSWVRAYVNGETYSRYTHCGEGYLNQNSFAVHIGIGTAAIIDSLKVTWLSGIEDIIYNVSPNQRLLMVEGSTSQTLPLELISFEAIPESLSAKLFWETQSEENVGHFDVLRSKDGVNFTKIGSVNAANENNSINRYSFDDTSLSNGQTYYYRLRIINFDDTQQFSKIVSVKIKQNEENSISILSNLIPSSQKSFNLISDKQQIVNLSLVSPSGQIIFRYSDYELKVGQNIINWETTLPQGTYFVSITGNERIIDSFKVVLH